MHDSERRRVHQRRLVGRIRVVDVVVFLLVLAVAWFLIPSPATDGDEPAQSPAVRLVDGDASA